LSDISFKNLIKNLNCYKIRKHIFLIYIRSRDRIEISSIPIYELPELVLARFVHGILKVIKKQPSTNENIELNDNLKMLIFLEKNGNQFTHTSTTKQKQNFKNQ
jgi:hypothetical protein